MKPRDAPEKRPSVIRAVLPPSPAPISALVGPVGEVKFSFLCLATDSTSAKVYLTSVLCQSICCLTFDLSRKTDLWHSGCSLGTLVPEDDYCALLEFACFQRGVEGGKAREKSSSAPSSSRSDEDSRVEAFRHPL